MSMSSGKPVSPTRRALQSQGRFNECRAQSKKNRGAGKARRRVHPERMLTSPSKRLTRAWARSAT